MEHGDNRMEFALLDTGKINMYGIYQLKDEPNLRDLWFARCDFIKQKGLTIDRNNYDFVYADTLKNETLENIYEKLNINHPKDFCGRSLSVSDIIVLNKDGKISSHYVDSYGYKEVPEFTAGLYNLEPVITITSSEYDFLHEGKTLTMHEADSEFDDLDLDQYLDSQSPNYEGKESYKLGYEVAYMLNGDYCVHEGEVDFGKGNGSFVSLMRIKTEDEFNSTDNRVLADEIGEDIAQAHKQKLKYVLNSLIPYLILHSEFAYINEYANRQIQEVQSKNESDTDSSGKISYYQSLKKYLTKCRTILNTKDEIALPKFPRAECGLLSIEEQNELDFREHILKRLPMPAKTEKVAESAAQPNENKLTVLAKRAGEPPVAIEIEDTLEAKQKIVGGNIECTYSKGLPPNTLLICNEEGKYLNLKPNIYWGDSDIICGDFLIVGLDKSGENRNLTAKEIEQATTFINENEASDYSGSVEDLAYAEVLSFKVNEPDELEKIIEEYFGGIDGENGSDMEM